MQQDGAFETNAQNENSYVFLQILPEEQHCTTSHIVCTQELIPKVFSLNEFHSLTSNFKGTGNHSQTLLYDGKNHSDKANHSADCTPERGKNTHAQQSTTHVEIIHNSQVKPSSLKFNSSKTEGRKAPGSNRVLPLITSVWEDADLLWKRQKPPKGGWKREVKGKGTSSSKRGARGSLDVGEISEEEDWMESQEQDLYGGSLHMAYSDFFMAKEGGEVREDCICGDCGAEFLTATQVLHHLVHHHRKAGVKLYQCFVCRRKRYPTLSQLNQHLSNAHGIPRPELTCRTCFMELAGESEAKAHSRKHQTPYTCSHCSLSHSQLGTHSAVPRFATRFLLAEHLREVHLPQERPHGCNVCGRQFIHEYVRDLHLSRRHHDLSLICPEVRHNSFTSPPLTSTPPLMAMISVNGDATENHPNTAISAVFNKPADGCGGNSGRIGASGDGSKLDSTGGEIRYLNASQKESVPSELTTEPLMCSKGGRHFHDEVSLLCHVFSCHTRETRVQLLKWAREMDREDALFEELWKSYSNLSGGPCANWIKNHVNLSNSFQLDTRKKGCSSASFTPIEWPFPKIQVLSDAENANANMPCNSDVSVGVKDSGSNSMEHVSSNLPPIADKCSSSALPIGDAIRLRNQSTCETSLKMGGMGDVPHAAGKTHTYQNASKQGRTDVESQMVTSRVTTTEEMVESETSSVPVDNTINETVKLCMSNILDSICNVLDKRSALKESKSPSVSAGSKRNVSSVRCLLCRYLAANPMALERHRRRRHFRNKHCPFCYLACPSVEAVWRHVSEVHLSPTKKSTDNDCVSAVETESQQLVLSQKSSQSSSGGLRCPVCKKTFPSRGKCNSHQETVHKLEVVSRPLSCDICSKKFQFQKALERHKIIHQLSKGKDDGPSLYKCPHCEQTFLRPGFLEPHIASHFENARKVGDDDNAGEKAPLGHPCPSCPRWLTTKAKLKAHVRTSHPPAHLRQRFVCNQCSVRCSTASGLRIHVRVHSGERPFSCSQCDASFNRKTALKKHIVAVHPACPSSENGSKGSFLKCPNCPSSFRDRSNLVRHFLQVHRGLRRFVCGLCGNRYGQNQDLRHHLKVKHGMEAARIIGSDRRSVDQIYVIPPLLDSLPANHPMVNEIKRIVEEEERKLNEDNLPQFASVPQQLHVRFHKDNGRNSDSVVEDIGKQAYDLNTLQRAPPEKTMDGGFNSCIASQSNLNTSGERKTVEISEGMEGVHKLSVKNAYLGAENRSTHENGATSSNASPCGRNLILDAIISSQISAETSEIHGGDSAQFHQIISHSLAEANKDMENNSCQSTEVNIIVANESLAATSHSIPFKMDSKDSKTLTTSDKEGKSVQKTTQSKRDATPGCHFCDQCGKEFIDATRLERHSKIHKNVKPHVCTVCGKSFVEKYNLKVHMRCHTGERPYKCEDCGKTMRYLKEVADHRRMHLGERPYICQECSRAFLRLRDLQRHQFTHSTEKKHKCPICDKEFSRLDHLRTIHMRVHDPNHSTRPKLPKKFNEVIGSKAENTSEKMRVDGKDSNELHLNNTKGISHSQFHTCKKCAKQFSTKTKLEQHLVLHSGQKEHKCPICGRCFALMSYLRAHQNTHRKREGYVQCPKCPRRFASEKTLSVHDEKFHRRIEKTKKFQCSETLSKAGKSKESSSDVPYEEEKFFLTRPGDFDVNLDLEDDMNIQEVALFDPASLSEAEKQNTFVYLHVISDDLQLGGESNLIE